MSRKEKFAIKIEKERFPDVPEERTVHVTHNGYQWQGMSLSPGEARKLITELEKFASPK